MLHPLVQVELKKLCDAKIIISRYSKWVANLVCFKKKNGEIRLYIDFKNLNRASIKDNYPLTKDGSNAIESSGV
jgi:hypothetical protein